MIRESQLLTWKKVPHTGMTVNIDIGEFNNLHPHDKKDVGLRLSLLALADTYGQKIEYSGPVYDSMAVEGNKIRLKFTHAAGGLVAKDGRPLKHVAIAGSDQKWVEGVAEVDGETLLVSSPRRRRARGGALRVGGESRRLQPHEQLGLPASPFRTDDWPVLTQGMWYPTTRYTPANDAPLARCSIRPSSRFTPARPPRPSDPSGRAHFPGRNASSSALPQGCGALSRMSVLPFTAMSVP